MNGAKAGIWHQAAQTIVNAGKIPIVIGETMIELLRTILTEEQALFITAFDKPSLSTWINCCKNQVWTNLPCLPCWKT
jgi:hypothetical protein